MKQKHLALIFVVTMSLLTVIAPTPSQARVWQFGSVTYFTVDQVCRDGVTVIAGYDKANDGGGQPPQPGDTASVAINTRFVQDSTFPNPDTEQYPIEAYGQRLAAPTDVLMTYNEDSLTADINDDGTFIIDFNIYGSQDIIWSQLLDIGDSIIVYSAPALNFILPVEDCYLDQLTLDQGATTTIDNTQLFVNDGLSNDGNVAYQLDAVPAHGTLRLNGMPLAVGEIFTQDDVNNNRLTYQHDSSATTSDSFAVHARATTRVSVDSSGTPGNNHSGDPSISADGDIIAFESDSTNLVVGDTNSSTDIFVHNQSEDTTTRESVASDGTQANGPSSQPALAPGGNAMAFRSSATNLVDPAGDCIIIPEQSDADEHIFRRSLGGITERYSVSSLRWAECYRGNQNSARPAISWDGIYIAFESDATNLLKTKGSAMGPSGSGGLDDTNNAKDIFTYDRVGVGGTANMISLVSAFPDPYVQSDGASFAPAISGDNDHIAFVSTATNLVSGDTNNLLDTFVRSGDTNVRVSVATDGTEANGTSSAPSLSFDGRYVAFHSPANNLVAGDTNNWIDIFVRDRDTDADGVFDEPGAVSTTRISMGSDGTQANGASFAPAISASGRYVAFDSLANNLVDGDSNGVRDVFVHDRETGETTLVSVAADGTQGNATSSNAAISADGSYVAFESIATNLVENDTNESTDVFVHYRGFSTEVTLVIEDVPGSTVYLPLVIR
ncbi:MAG: cadherin-like domain-containing protein [Chloroflexota bacterium]